MKRFRFLFLLFVSVVALVGAPFGYRYVVSFIGRPEGQLDSAKGTLLIDDLDAELYMKSTVAGVKTGWQLIGTGASSASLVPWSAVSDAAYDATSWNGSTNPPTQNSIRDKFESLSGGLTINSTDGRYPVRSSSSGFADGAFYDLNSHADVGLDGKLFWGPGTASSLYRQVADLVYANSGADVSLIVKNGTGQSTSIETFGGNSYFRGSGGLYLVNNLLKGLLITGGGSAIVPTADNDVDLGQTGGVGFKTVAGYTFTVSGSGPGANYERGVIKHNANSTGWSFDSQAGGTGIYRDFVFQGGGTNLARLILDSSGNPSWRVYKPGDTTKYFEATLNAGGNALLGSGNGYIYVQSVLVPLSDITPSAPVRLGANSSSGGFSELWMANGGTGNFPGSGAGTVNYERGQIKHNGNASGWVFDSQALGTGVYRNGYLATGGTNYVGWQPNEVANETGLLIRYNGSIQKVTVGAVDSGGTGFRGLRVPN